MKRKTLIKSWPKSTIQNIQTEKLLLPPTIPDHLILPLATPILQLHLTQISTNPSTTTAMGNCFRLPRPKPESRPNQSPQYLAIEPEPEPASPEPESRANQAPQRLPIVPKFGDWGGPPGILVPVGSAEAGGTDLRLEKFKIRSLNFDDVGGDRGVDAPVVVKNGGGGGKIMKFLRCVIMNE
ncbi:hypothetical protein Droror1_Dr00016750 [Drosera rotundifolia]